MNKVLRTIWGIAVIAISAVIVSGSSSSFAAAAVNDSGTLSISASQKNAILSMTCCAENSQPTFDYGYAENIDDGRGITFGIIGFTTGCGDGTKLLKRIKALDPNNVLAAYLPAFEAIDKMKHDEDGNCDSTQGLDNFIKDFNAHGKDAKVKQAQLEELNTAYWEPAVAQANKIGIKNAITMGEMYDSCVNHGEDGDSSDMGLKQLIAKANKMAGGTPKSGIDESIWLKAFLSIRKAYLNSDPTWQEAIDRIDMYSRILESGNITLKTPFKVTCYGDPFTITGNQP